jgi:hypothetical protein
MELQDLAWLDRSVDNCTWPLPARSVTLAMSNNSQTIVLCLKTLKSRLKVLQAAAVSPLE